MVGMDNNRRESIATEVRSAKIKLSPRCHYCGKQLTAQQQVGIPPLYCSWACRREHERGKK